MGLSCLVNRNSPCQSCNPVQKPPVLRAAATFTTSTGKSICCCMSLSLENQNGNHDKRLFLLDAYALTLLRWGGYAGIDNMLFYKSNTKMYFGDAKGAIEKLVTEVKARG